MGTSGLNEFVVNLGADHAGEPRFLAALADPSFGATGNLVPQLRFDTQAAGMPGGGTFFLDDLMLLSPRATPEPSCVWTIVVCIAGRTTRRGRTRSRGT